LDAATAVIARRADELDGRFNLSGKSLIDARRRVIVDDARALVRDFKDRHDNSILRDPRYAEMRPYLRPEVIRDLEGGGKRVVLHGGGVEPHWWTDPIRDEADRLEREWGLI
jgi:hypothetical protein